MSKLSLNPQLLWKNTLPFVYWDDFFSESDLKTIEQYCTSHGVEKSKIITSDNTLISNDVRHSEIKIHYANHTNEWLFFKLLTVAELINDNFYRFDLLGFDHFQYTEYNGAGTKYDYHTDMIFGKDVPIGHEISRKLSFSLVLSDTQEYEGGDLEIKLTSRSTEKIDQKRGRVIAFPSYLLHRVSPLISGSRKSIVFWAVGPKFK